MRLRTVFGRRMGYPTSAPGSRPHRTVGLSSIFSGHPGDLETARRCRVGHSAVPPTQGVGLRRCVLRLDGRCSSQLASGLIDAGTMAYPVVMTGVAVAPKMG